KNRIENEALAHASKIVPEARGVAAARIQEATGYRDALIARAEGDTQRFRLLADEYRKAPEVTRKRLYLETMQEVMRANPKVLAGRDNNILYLPMANPGAAGSVDTPLMRLPATKALPDLPDNRLERAPRADGRTGGR
ncbi:MAG TPA: FtsH protease activity modulator HflK, partial [Arenimonas sp.]|nr:FtsH protease activity modulator HflK [Arenimonas sp.]